MNKFCLSRILVALLFIAPLAAFTVPGTGNLESERRQIAAFPKIPSKLRAGTIKSFFQGIDAFFADRFPLRSPLLKLSMALYEAGGDSLNTDKCYRGKEHWLFLGNSYNRCVDKLQGGVRLSGNALKRQTEDYGRRRDAAKNSGAEFFVLIGPNKSSIYPEYLPPVVVPAQRRFLSPLLDALHKEGVKVYDPTDRLIAAKSTGLLYWRTDTHWNQRGAYEAFEGFRQYAKLPELPPLSFTQAAVHNGDLISIGGYTNFPLSAGDNFTLHWSTPLSLHEENGLITNTRAASEKTAWIFGDSFREALKPYFTAMFREVRLFSHGDFEKMLLSQDSKPDIILWVQVERSFAEIN